MRTELKIDSENLFERRLQEKEAQRQALFGQKEAESEEVKAYVYRQVVLNRKRTLVGKPLFHPKF